MTTVKITTKEIEALNNWVDFNQYLRANEKSLTIQRLEIMLSYEVSNKCRINIVTRLNNKIYEKKRNDNLKRILGMK